MFRFKRWRAATIVCCGLAWATGRGWIGIPLPAPEVVLSMASAALAMAVALGVLAFFTDLRGSTRL